MSVHRHHFANLARGLAGMNEFVHAAMAPIPGGLVIDDHRNPRGRGGPADTVRVSEADGQRLLHHYRKFRLGGRFHGRGMVKRAAEGRDRLGLRLRKHFLDGAETARAGNLEALSVPGKHGGIRFGHPHQIHIRAPLRLAEKSTGMPMHEAGHGKPQRSGTGGLAQGRGAAGNAGGGRDHGSAGNIHGETPPAKCGHGHSIRLRP